MVTCFSKLLLVLDQELGGGGGHCLATCFDKLLLMLWLELRGGGGRCLATSFLNGDGDSIFKAMLECFVL